MTDLVLTAQRGPIFEITLNRPEKRNAINLEMLGELDSAVTQASRASSVRAVWVRGAGPMFSAGIDLNTLARLADRYGPEWLERSRTITEDVQAVLTRLERLEVPTLALLHGYCLGLAFELALACDLRLATEGTRLGLPETRLGIIPDAGGTTRLTRLVGPARAKELIFTGRQFDAALAERWGLVNAVVAPADLEARAAELTDEIGQAAPLAVGAAKRVIDGLADIDRGLMLEAFAQSGLFAGQDFARRMQTVQGQHRPQRS